MREGTRACPDLLLRQAVREGPRAWRMTTERLTSHGAGNPVRALALKVPPGRNGSAPMFAVARTS